MISDRGGPEVHLENMAADFMKSEGPNYALMSGLWMSFAFKNMFAPFCRGSCNCRSRWITPGDAKEIGSNCADGQVASIEWEKSRHRDTEALMIDS
jgi:hypothetical protein